MVTPYSHYTNDELVRIVYQQEVPDPLLLELAFRLESDYPEDLEEPRS